MKSRISGSRFHGQMQPPRTKKSRGTNAAARRGRQRKLRPDRRLIWRHLRRCLGRTLGRSLGPTQRHLVDRIDVGTFETLLGFLGLHLLLPILDFLCIHPFTDGNGRVARLLTLQLLYHAAYEVGRYISLERIFEESRESYYEALEASSQGWHEDTHDVRPWMRYLWGTLLRAYKELEDRVGTITGGRGSKARQVRAAIERKVMPFSISEIERDCPGVSRDHIRRLLRQLRDEGRLVVEGRGPGARWRRAEVDLRSTPSLPT